MASIAIPTLLSIATPLGWRHAFETRSDVVIDHNSYHRKIDRTRSNRAKEGSNHASRKQVVIESIRAYTVSSRWLLVSLSLELEQHGILTTTRE